MDASDVVVTDTLPAGMTYMSGSCRGTTVLTCSEGLIASGTTKSFTIQLKIPADYLSSSGKTMAEVANTATVSSREIDLNRANNSSTVHTAVTAAAFLKLTMTASPGSVREGNIVTYMMDFTNTGPSDAIQGYILDYLPTGFTFVDSSVLPCAGGVGTVLCNLGPVVPAGFTLSFPIEVSVPPDFLQPGTSTMSVVNSAMIRSGTVDPNPGYDPAVVTTTVIH